VPNPSRRAFFWAAVSPAASIAARDASRSAVGEPPSRSLCRRLASRCEGGWGRPLKNAHLLPRLISLFQLFGRWFNRQSRDALVAHPSAMFHDTVGHNKRTFWAKTRRELIHKHLAIFTKKSTAVAANAQCSGARAHSMQLAHELAQFLGRWSAHCALDEDN
jgi:hypothetical protein